MKLLDLHFYHLRNAEHLRFFKDSVGFIQADATVKTAMATALAKLQPPLARMEALFMTDESSPLTPELLGLDGTRDKYLNGIWMAAEGFTNHFDPAMSAAAEALAHSIEVYGGVQAINRASYSGQTTTIENLINDWATKPALTAALTTLGFVAWSNALKVVNQNFLTKYNQRTADNALLATDDTIKEQRGLIDAAWEDVRDDLEANERLATAANKPLWQKAISQINEKIRENQVLLDSRAGRAAAKKKKNGGDTPTPPTPPTP